jgi:hypothetical protein
MGVALFIVSEALFFLAIFWAFFHSALSPNIELGGQWPPMGIEAVNPFELPLLNTVILLSSGVTVTYAHHSLIQGNRSGALYGLVATVVLAIIFTALQGVEYTVSSFTISDGVFGSSFYFGTGFHGYNSNLLLKPKQNYISTIRDLSAKLQPYWVTGFSDGEGSFSVRFTKNSQRKSGWRVSPVFAIELHVRDLKLLERIQAFFGVGIVTVRKTRNTAVYTVQSFNDLTDIIIPHFDKYPLISQKQADFLLFKSIVSLLNKKEQSTLEGIKKILNYRASMNLGLSVLLKKAFPNTIAVPRPLVNFNGIPDPNWVTGFIDGEGCFHIGLKKSSLYAAGYQVKISFSVSQHSRDEVLLSEFITYLGCGTIEKTSTRPNGVVYIVYKYSKISDNIIPFFDKYPLQGTKFLDYKDFCKIADLMGKKSHLTVEGLNEIRLIRASMNNGRNNI